MRVLVAGATGQLGRRVVAELQRRGHHVRALGRDAARLQNTGAQSLHVAHASKPDTFAGCCDGMDAVFSCMGASLALTLRLPDPDYLSVDPAGNTALIEEAERAQIGRFVYVSLAGGEQLRDLQYADAHERVVDRLRQSEMQEVVLRPTGFFSALEPLVEMARYGIPAVVGPGKARSNPIDDDDLAHACADAVLHGEGEVVLGGPEVLSRDEMMGRALVASARDRRIVHVPAWLLDTAAWFLTPILPRLAALLRFVAVIMVTDVVAPAVGEVRLGDHFSRLARKPVPRPASPVFSEDVPPTPAGPVPSSHRGRPRRNTAHSGDAPRV